ncbi:urease subunit beta [Halobiforma lacisalsi AJ5]|uniref:Urease subunit beta n=1 Tax=Natronobacterium lacisalsi AJ5 TaxID=358396 RepID=M0LHY9_NATLA|nr:urease subunit beta [Halobiforma lacisalsi]APW99489.1 urease subunit beta [Halobiforma lacisalsi AJ5]EMA31610.1 urease subunit beta [Halobiforma lacisalsi AJ5]
MTNLVPGELDPAGDPVRINEGRPTATVTVENIGDRPVQVGSHFHFFEVNPGLEFDRESAYGMRLDVPAGTAVRFEPGVERDVDLVAIGGDRIVRGMAGLVEGELDDDAVKERALERARERGYIAESEPDTSGGDRP